MNKLQYADELVQVKFDLQRQVLDSWDQMNAMQQQHARLLQRLQHVREQINSLNEPSLFDQLFDTQS